MAGCTSWTAALQTVPIDWIEWLATIAIGMGAWPMSWIVRFISRCVSMSDSFHTRVLGLQ